MKNFTLYLIVAILISIGVGIFTNNMIANKAIGAQQVEAAPINSLNPGNYGIGVTQKQLWASLQYGTVFIDEDGNKIRVFIFNSKAYLYIVGPNNEKVQFIKD